MQAYRYRCTTLVVMWGELDLEPYIVGIPESGGQNRYKLNDTSVSLILVLGYPSLFFITVFIATHLSTINGQYCLCLYSMSQKFRITLNISVLELLKISV